MRSILRNILKFGKISRKDLCMKMYVENLIIGALKDNMLTKAAMIQAETLHNLVQVSFPAELTSMYQFMTKPISIKKKHSRRDRAHMGYSPSYELYTCISVIGINFGHFGRK